MLLFLLAVFKVFIFLCQFLLHLIKFELGYVAALQGMLSALLLLLKKPVHEVNVLDLELRELDALNKALKLLNAW